MLVEINLLTEKNKKDVTYWFIAAIILFVLIVSIIALKIVHDQVQNDIQQLANERQTITEQIATLQQQLEEKPVSHYEQLKMVVEKTEQRIIPASELLAELVRLLPNYGYFLSFEFHDPDRVVFEVRFDQIGSVAAYTNALNHSALISEVTLFSIHTEPLGDEMVNGYLPRYVTHFELTVDREAFFVKEDD